MPMLMSLLHHLEFGRELLTVALEGADNGAGLTIDLVGCGYAGPYPAAAEGDSRATIIRDVITERTVRMFTAPPETALCLLCSEPRYPPEHDIALVVAVYANTPTPAAICCSPVCMKCWRRLPEDGDLMHAIMERFRTFLPNLHLLHVAEAGRA